MDCRWSKKLAAISEKTSSDRKPPHVREISSPFATVSVDVMATSPYCFILGAYRLFLSRPQKLLTLRIVIQGKMVTYKFHQYQVVGRALPTEAEEHPKIYRMKLWATNEVRAKSKFCCILASRVLFKTSLYFLRKLKKVKKSNGQVLAINEIFEKNPTTIKNYGIWLRYQSRTGYHNMYKEYRDTTLNGAVEQMYTEMASRHRVRHHCIQIIKTATIPAKLCKRESTKQFHDSKIKFPLVFRKVRPPTRKLKTTYKASRPNLFM
ncbi:60S ribosomal protein L18a [Striga asiatica]|uniref:60S ribosomal protein L18a n=1 Tax=Striga asiatica TaxID=4170 RepID=A0A5A7Q0J1_STRAF|nr:60S ribosomal protein L18a [Striga asiatica]